MFYRHTNRIRKPTATNFSSLKLVENIQHQHITKSFCSFFSTTMNTSNSLCWTHLIQDRYNNRPIKQRQHTTFTLNTISATILNGNIYIYIYQQQYIVRRLCVQWNGKGFFAWRKSNCIICTFYCCDASLFFLFYLFPISALEKLTHNLNFVKFRSEKPRNKKYCVIKMQINELKNEISLKSHFNFQTKFFFCHVANLFWSNTLISSVNHFRFVI